jgi:hypothetical protein
MANSDYPKGFAPFGVIKKQIVLESGSAIYPGDFVRLASDGQVDPAAAGETILGLALNYCSASGQEVLVSCDPDQLYVGQADETEIDAQTDIGNVCDIVATAGNSTYKTSRQEVDSSDVNTTSGQLLLLGYERRVDNALGGFCDVIVKINEHQGMGKDAFAGI